MNVPSVKEWSHAAWVIFHAVAVFSTRRLTPHDYKRFVNLFANTLLCDTCRKHFIRSLHQNPVRPPYPSWALMQQNAVNERTGKRRMSPDDVSAYYPIREYPEACKEYLGYLDRGVAAGIIDAHDVAALDTFLQYIRRK